MMWNHVPRMWEKMEEGGIRLTPISPAEMSHLFAFLLFIRYAEEPGDPVKGESILTARKCNVCHSIDAQGGTIGPDLAKWAPFVNPIVWAQKMWTHALTMKENMSAMGIAWSRFEGEDLNDIVAYIRSRTAGEAKEYIEPGSAARGKERFETRGCATCHTIGGGKRVGPDLLHAELPESLSGIAMQMWNHAPTMLAEISKRGIKKDELSAQDMADIITYLLTRRYFLGAGDAEAGAAGVPHEAMRRVPQHSRLGRSRRAQPGPDRGQRIPHSHGAHHVEVRSRHAQQDGRPWNPLPNFEGQEMTDLIALLNQESLKEISNGGPR